MRKPGGIFRFFVFTILIRLTFWTPIQVSFFREQQGLNLTQIGLLTSLFWLLLMGLSVPLGALADTWGKPQTLVASAIALAVGMFGLTRPDWFYVSYVLWAVGETLYSTASTALLYEMVQMTDNTQPFERVAGRLMATTAITQAVASVIGGWLAQYSQAVTFTFTAIAALFAAGISLTFRTRPVVETAPKPSYLSVVRSATTITLHNPLIRYVVLFSTLVTAIPITLIYRTVQPFGEAAGVPVFWIGILYGTQSVCAALLAANAHRLVKRFRFLPLAWGGTWLIVVSCVLLYLFPSRITMPLFLVIGAIPALMQPLLASVLQGQLADEQRTTISAMSWMLVGFVIAVVEPGLMYLADRWGITMTIVTTGGLFLFSGGMVLYRLKPHLEVNLQQGIIARGTDAVSG